MNILFNFSKIWNCSNWMIFIYWKLANLWDLCIHTTNVHVYYRNLWQHYSPQMLIFIPINVYNIRHRHESHVTHSNSSEMSRSFIHQGPKLWPDLPMYGRDFALFHPLDTARIHIFINRQSALYHLQIASAPQNTLWIWFYSVILLKSFTCFYSCYFYFVYIYFIITMYFLLLWTYPCLK